MLSLVRWSVACLFVVVTAGCGEGGSSSPATPSGGAEVPTPGESVDLGNPGPLPAGQTEPGAAPAEPATDESTTPEASAAPTAAPAGEVKLQVTDWAGVEKLIAAQRGKVVVVDLWATSCPPCRREFPNLVKIHQNLGQFVACISVSTDYDGIPSKPLETYQGPVEEFLTAQQATFDNVLCSQPGEEVYDALKIGSIPAVFVYDQTGKQVKTFADPVDGQEFTYEKDILPFVQSLLVSQ